MTGQKKLKFQIIFQTLDRDDSGTLDYDEFKKLMMARDMAANGLKEDDVRIKWKRLYITFRAAVNLISGPSPSLQAV
jgi:hypothetical protein